MKNKWIAIFVGIVICSCMDPLKNYDACIEIETARCEKRHSCRDNETFQSRFDDFDKETCIAYIKEHCRTREIQGEGWDDRDVERCAQAIRDDVACDQLDPGVDETQEYLEDACWFIEAEEDDERTDTSTDTSTDTQSGDDASTDTHADTASDTTSDTDSD